MVRKKTTTDAKVTLTITIKKELITKLKSLVPCGKISELVEKLVEEKTKKMEQEIANQYRQEALDKAVDQQNESWYIIHKGKSKEKNEKQH